MYTNSPKNLGRGPQSLNQKSIQDEKSQLHEIDA